MSYILDALRRAEAERERDRTAVPGLHAQTLPPVPVEPARLRAGAWRAALAVIAVLLVVGGAWWTMRGGAPANPSIGSATAPSTAPAPAPVSPRTNATAEVAATTPPPLASARLPEPAPAPAPAPAALPARATGPAPADTASLPPLPADVRLVSGGSIWSDTPAARMLILNGQVFHEGEHPAPDATLERIGPKAAVIVVRGTRYQLAY